jgi:alkaline phosphatase D
MVEDGNPAFSLFLGDFIYSDHIKYYGDAQSSFSKAYRQTIRDKHYNRMARWIPMYYIFDDHEIKENWDDGQNGSYGNAIKIWDQYCGVTNPVPYNDSDRVYYYNFWYGDVAFFVVDERTYRTSESVDDGPNKTMLGDVQNQRLKDWLLEVNDTAKIKVIASGAAWTVDYDDGDGWRGYKYARSEILDFIGNNSIKNVVLLSGDVHYVFVVEILPGLFEFSSSPISAFPPGPTEFLEDPPEKLLFLDSRDAGITDAVSVYISFLDFDTTQNPPVIRFRTWYKGYMTKDKPLWDQNFTLSTV